MELKKALKIFSLTSLNEVNSTELKKLYRKLAAQKHPDKDSGSNEEFVELREAYLFLSTQVKEDNQTSKNFTNSTLKNLSKDEILSKYISDTKDLELRVASFKQMKDQQIRTLAVVKKGAESILDKFEKQKAKLREELDIKLSKLEKKVNPGFLKRVFFFFWPRMSEQEFWRNYAIEVQEFTRKDADVDVEFFKEMLSQYGDGLNKIAESLTE